MRQLGPDIQVLGLTEHTLIHRSFLYLEDGTRFPCNGLVYIQDSFCLIVDTPVDTVATNYLLDYLQDNLQLQVMGVVVSHAHGRGTHTFVVTNRHLVDGVRRGGLVFTQKRNGKPVLGQRFQLNIEDFPHAWFMHPDPEVDLAIERAEWLAKMNGAPVRPSAPML